MTEIHDATPGCMGPGPHDGPGVYQAGAPSPSAVGYCLCRACFTARFGIDPDPRRQFSAESVLREWIEGRYAW